MLKLLIFKISQFTNSKMGDLCSRNQDIDKEDSELISMN